MSNSNSLQDVLAELQRNYIASMPGKITVLDGLWRAGELDKLRTEYHKLKGTGKTYGLPEVTQVGEALERLCDAPAREVSTSTHGMDTREAPTRGTPVHNRTTPPPPSAPTALDRAVPLSLNLLAQIHEQRTKGEAPRLEESGEFRAILRLVDELV